MIRVWGCSIWAFFLSGKRLFITVLHYAITMLRIFALLIPWFIWILPSNSLNSVLDSFMVRLPLRLYFAVTSCKQITKSQAFSLQKWHIHCWYFIVLTKRCGGIAPKQHARNRMHENISCFKLLQLRNIYCWR